MYVVALMMAAVSAVTVANDEESAVWNDKCFHCIDEGYMFCSADGIKGTCVDVSCEQDVLEFEEKKAAYGQCTLRAHSCVETADAFGNPLVVGMMGFKQCAYTRDVANCPAKIQITKAQIESGGKMVRKDDFETDGEQIVVTEGEFVNIPFDQLYKMGAERSCITQIEVAADVTDDNMRAAFEFTEWQDDIFIQMFRLEDGTVFDKDSSTLFAQNSFYYTREAKDGDLAGRVPISNKQSYHLVMINKGEEEQSLKLQYGAAVQSAVVGVATLAATIAAICF